MTDNVSPISAIRPEAVNDYLQHASIFFDTASKSVVFRDMTSPGTQEYTMSVLSGETRGLGFLWCGDDAAMLEQISKPLLVELYLNGERIPESQIMIADALDGRYICRRWASLISGWQSGKVVTLEIKITISEPIFDGDKTYQAGVYIHRITVIVS
jgi:hypothetical protein